MMIRFLSRSFLMLVLLLTAYPFVWMLLASFKSNQQIYKPDQLIPSSFDPFAFQILFSNNLFQFNEVLARSILLSGGQALFACLVTAAAGYAIAKGYFSGKEPHFWCSHSADFISQASNEPLSFRMDERAWINRKCIWFFTFWGCERIRGRFLYPGIQESSHRIG